MTRMVRNDLRVWAVMHVMHAYVCTYTCHALIHWATLKALRWPNTVQSIACTFSGGPSVHLINGINVSGCFPLGKVLGHSILSCDLLTY